MVIINGIDRIGYLHHLLGYSKHNLITITPWVN